MKVRGGRRGAGGFSLVDVIFALSIVSIAILGVISLMLAIRARNDANSTSRHATLACQEVMEHILADVKSGNAGWVAKWHELYFQPRKVVAIDKDRPGQPKTMEPFKYGSSEEENIYNCGRVFVNDVSDAAMPNTLYEISVVIDTSKLTDPPIKARLVTRRSPIK